MKTRMSTVRILLVLIPVVVVLCLFTGSVLAADLYPVGESFHVDLSDKYTAYYAEDLDTHYFVLKSEPDSFLIADVKEYGGRGFTGEEMADVLEDDSTEFDSIRFTGKAQQANGFRWRPCKRLFADKWHNSILLYYGTHIMRISCFEESDKKLYDFINFVHPTGYQENTFSSIQSENVDASELYEKGKAVYDDKDYASALPYLERAAEMGSTESMVLLGNMYSFGYGVKKSVEAGRDYYLKAADMGNVEAQFLVGEMYSAGFGIEKSEEIANRYYIDAADQGYGDAQYKIGSRYYYGNSGVTQDYDLAFKYLNMAADQQIAGAQFLVGQMYHYGLSVERSFEKAVEWYQKSADQGYAKGQWYLGCMYANGMGVTMSNEKAAEWYRKSADQGYVNGQHMVGHMYFYGLGIDKSYEKALEWFQKAADQGEVISQWYLGYMYENGLGVAKSYEKAIEWYQKAAEQGHEDAQEKVKELQNR